MAAKPEKDQKQWWEQSDSDSDDQKPGVDDIIQEFQVASTRLADAAQSIVMDAGASLMFFVNPLQQYKPETPLETASGSNAKVLKKPAKIREEAENRNKQLLEAAFHGTLHLYVDYAGEYKYLTDTQFRLQQRSKDLQALIERKYPKGTFKMLEKGKYEILPVYDSKRKKILEQQQIDPPPKPAVAKNPKDKAEVDEVATKNMADEKKYEKMKKRADKIAQDQKDPKKAEALLKELTELRRQLKDLESLSTKMRGYKSIRDPESTDPKDPRALFRGEIPRIHKQLDQLKKEKFPGSKTILETLIEAAADINYVNEDGFSALMFAARNGHKSAVEALINLKADVNLRNQMGRTALHYAAQFAHTDLVEVLKKVGKADRKMLDALGKSPKDLALEEHQATKGLKEEVWADKVYKQRMYLKVDELLPTDEADPGMGQIYSLFGMHDPEAVQPEKEWKPDTWRISKVPDPACRVDPMSESRFLSRWQSTAKRLGPTVKAKKALDVPAFDSKFLTGVAAPADSDFTKGLKALLRPS